MTSVVRLEVINNALTALGIRTITSLDYDDEIVVAADNNLDTAYSELLSDNPWNFAEVEKKLTLSADNISSEYQYTYLLPQDPPYIIGRRIIPDGHYEVRQGYVITDIADVSMVYTAKVSIEYLPQKLRGLLGYMLARKLIAYSSSSAVSQQQMLEVKINQAKKDARFNDATEMPSRHKIRPAPKRRYW